MTFIFTTSKIISQVKEFHWRDWDYMWQPEACMEIWNDLRSVDAFRSNTTIKESFKITDKLLQLKPSEELKQALLDINFMGY